MDVTMPQLGETVVEATLTRWLKNVGDAVAVGDPLFEVSTDKAEMEIPAISAGTLDSIAVRENETVRVGTLVAVIGDGNTTAGGAAPASAPDRVAASNADAGHHDEPGHSGGSAESVGSAGELSPIVRRLLKENGLAAADVVGTGPRGRVTRDDVLLVIARRTSADGPDDTNARDHIGPASPDATDSKRPADSAPSAPDVVDTPASLRARETIVPFNLVRRRTAEHMVRSKAISPHALMVVEVDFSNVDRVRNARAASWKQAEGSSLTYLPFIARAVVDAIAKYPHVNARVGQGQLHVFGTVNLGIAVDLGADGLVVPVVHGADGKRLPVIAREIAALASAARGRRATPDDFADGTFTITNPGPYGTLMTFAIINQPQVAILATDGVRPRPVAVPTGDGEYAVAVRPVGNLALTFDHRAFDGGYAARFLNEIKTAVETRDWKAEL